MLQSGKPYLVLDGGALRVGAGILRDGQWLAVRETEGEALQTLFDGTRDVLDEAGMKLGNVAGFIYNAGPGSVLGIRLACMALGGWLSLDEHRDASLHAYQSLGLTAAHRLHTGAQTPFVVAADYREGRFIAMRVEGPSLPGPQLLDAAQITATGHPVYRLPQRKVWKSNTTVGEVIDYPFHELPGLLATPGLLHAADKPEPFTCESPEYVKWDAQRHR